MASNKPRVVVSSVSVCHKEELVVISTNQQVVPPGNYFLISRSIP